MFVVAVWVVNLSCLHANLKGDIMRDLTLGLILAGMLVAIIIMLADPPKTCASGFCYATCYYNYECIGKCWCAKPSDYQEGICVPPPGD